MTNTTAMKRDYDGVTGTDEVVLFTGTEIEHTAAHGKKTLFVVGTDHDIRDLNKLAQDNNCDHIYLGANFSFYRNGPDVPAMVWRDMIMKLLELGYTVTLDFKIEYLNKFLELGIDNDEPNFIPMVSVDFPNAEKLHPNTHFKIDDVDFKFSNSGVWVYKLDDLLDEKRKTAWEQYGSDKVLK